MYSGLLHAHSGFRWFLLVALIGAIYQLFAFRKSGKSFSATKSLGILALAITHIQVLLGLAMYFMSPWYKLFKEEGAAIFKNSVQRFYVLEHPVMMVLAAIFITIGYSKSKRATDDKKAYSQRITWYLVGLVLILAAIPWPFRFGNAGWF